MTSTPDWWALEIQYPESLLTAEIPLMLSLSGGGPCGIMANMQDSGLEVREFELYLYYYVHFWTNILGKGMNSLFPPAMG